MKKITRAAVALAAGTLGALGAATIGTAQPAPAEAAVVYFKVSPGSERAVNVWDWKDGRGVHERVNPGDYSHWVIVMSARQDAGCNWYEGGELKYKRSNRPQIHNYIALKSKLTVSQRDCRAIRGDSIAAGRG